MKTKLIAIILIAFTVSAFSQQNNDVVTGKKYSKAFGVGAGFTTGVGFSFRYFPKKYGVQINAAPYYNNYGSEVFVSAGATLLYSINENKVSNFYAYLGNHYLYSKLNQEAYGYDPYGYNNYYYNRKVTREYLNSGIGVGIEFHSQKRITLNLMVGYAQYESFKSLFFTAETALYYRFN
ncbi:MAG: hypothetical protein COZ21_06215 [Bacteroidetes bacterium CG_4_10_14_3_um_filter_31_20]|nr:hypothetical protein [Bacteroidota bacterium]PIY04604.1 MAG: hypothetical protein COZ21_06215 [Bacteroidetes bacterium CG_4_10_14_3_um_filter_31_20]